jgi:hypothetical protein
MATLRRLIVLGTFAAVFSAVLMASGPAMADDAAGKGAAVKSRSAAASKDYTARRGRAALHRKHYVDCSGAWCGRQFVLILGVSY